MKLQTIVIHNDNELGAAGYANKNMASISTYKYDYLFAVHELGHSLLELGDEYSYSLGSTAETKPNCEVENCPKWLDLDTHLKSEGRLCQSRGCSDKSGYIGTSSFMHNVFDDIGEVNLRYSCCTHIALTQNMPGYCAKYDFGQGGLLAYCQNNYQGYGGQLAYLPISHTDIDIIPPVFDDV